MAFKRRTAALASRMSFIAGWAELDCNNGVFEAMDTPPRLRSWSIICRFQRSTARLVVIRLADVILIFFAASGGMRVTAPASHTARRSFAMVTRKPDHSCCAIFRRGDSSDITCWM